MLHYVNSKVRACFRNLYRQVGICREVAFIDKLVLEKDGFYRQAGLRERRSQVGLYRKEVLIDRLI